MTCCLKNMDGYFSCTSYAPSCPSKVTLVPNKQWFDGDLNPCAILPIRVSDHLSSVLPQVQLEANSLGNWNFPRIDSSFFCREGIQNFLSLIY